MIIGLFTVLIIVLFAIDQWIKYTVVSTMALGAVHQVIPGVLSLTYLKNDGAAWSMLEGQQWFFYIVSILALGILIYFLIHYRHDWRYDLGLALMIAGTLGNFVDRLRNGFVVDMFQLDFISFPIFNFADSCLTVGVICLMIAILLEDKREKSGRSHE
ncbi:lipoprotein signal peptidase [Secundilactobacillus collinoides DSM 20515 = JCM 1123]|uniref:Lipoprotein signal peptidase n=1 Tax=Secundilactobacillus collinoides DSM 20515 = JCM 1123 TaxID=1423733 RepID=A0A0R2BF08_SECCO|nr:lipoprotein signal peptidase [Secundilactobacillus collinoides DSM 20515 = JCM 1123]